MKKDNKVLLFIFINIEEQRSMTLEEVLALRVL